MKSTKLDTPQPAGHTPPDSVPLLGPEAAAAQSPAPFIPGPNHYHQQAPNWGHAPPSRTVHAAQNVRRPAARLHWSLQGQQSQQQQQGAHREYFSMTKFLMLWSGSGRPYCMFRSGCACVWTVASFCHMQAASACLSIWLSSVLAVFSCITLSYMA